VIAEILDQLTPPGPLMPTPQRLQLLVERMRNVIKLGTAAEEKYPKAANLDKVRIRMLQAAQFLAARQEEGAQSLMLGVAKRIMDSPAGPEVRVEADRVLTTDEVKTLAPEKAEQAIRAYAKRFETTPAAWAALAYAADMAGRQRLAKLRAEMLDELEKKHMGDSPDVRRVLRKAGRQVDVGRPFEAELVKLDGARLVLPRDLLGKVVVIDFWATWCPPCAAAVPEMKAAYEKFKPKGVEFVGISLDRNRAEMEKFIQDTAQMWVQTFSGKEWEDPTAEKYGIRAIPSVWVVGRDGKVTSTDARLQLEQEIQKALEAKKE
jgi:thiol-disulfide isomerase/thioredoxin